MDSRYRHFWTSRPFTFDSLGTADHGYAANYGLIIEIDFEGTPNGSTKNGSSRLSAQTHGGDCEEAQYIYEKLQFHCRSNCEEMVSIGLKAILGYPAAS